MPANHEAPLIDDLVEEQRDIQSRKFQGRLLGGYSGLMFPDQHWLRPSPSAVSDFCAPYCIGERVTLEGVLGGFHSLRNEPVRWVDMGGGRGLCMRQLGADPETRSWLQMTNVDLFNFGLVGLDPKELEYLEMLAPNSSDDTAAPQLIQEDITKVILPEPATIITSIEAVQYLQDPLVAVCNWYNQLEAHGLMIIATEHDWSSLVHFAREPGGVDMHDAPTEHLLCALESAGIPFAATHESDWENGIRPRLYGDRFRTLVIQKVPDTRLILNSAVTRLWNNPFDYKIVYYEAPATSAGSIIEAVTVAQ